MIEQYIIKIYFLSNHHGGVVNRVALKMLSFGFLGSNPSDGNFLYSLY